MERHQGQDGPYRAWNHASAGEQPRQRAPEPGGFKPLSPVRPLVAFPPNEPYHRRVAAPVLWQGVAGVPLDAPGYLQGAGGYPQTPTYTPQGAGGYPQTPTYTPQGAGGYPQAPTPPPQGAGGYPQVPTNPPQGAGGYPQTPTYTPQGADGYPQAPTNPPQGAGGYPHTPTFAPQDAGGYPQAPTYTPQAAPPAWPQPWGNPPQPVPPAAWAPPPQGTWTGAQGNAPQPKAETQPRNPRAPHSDPAAPVPSPGATAPWLPPHITPAPEPEQPARRTFLQPVPQTAPLVRPAADWPAEEGGTRPTETPAEAAPAVAPPDAPQPPPATAPGWPVDDMDGWDARPDPDSADEDSGRFEPVAQPPLCEPVPVPTLGYMPRRRGRGKHILRGLLLVLAALAVLVAALYFTGALGRLASLLNPSAAGIPGVFALPPVGVLKTTVAPAITAPAPALASFTVSPAVGKAPVRLVFTLETNAAVSQIHLLREDGGTVYASATATPQSDGLLWQAAAVFGEPYAGRVLAYLQDGAAQWRRGDIACEVSVQ